MYEMLSVLQLLPQYRIISQWYAWSERPVDIRIVPNVSSMPARIPPQLDIQAEEDIPTVWAPAHRDRYRLRLRPMLEHD